MADKPNPFAALMERVAQGDQQAIAEIYEKYHKAIIFVIRQRLKRYAELRAVNDSLDFLQEVWFSTLADPEKLREFATFEEFLKYLAGVACNKVDKAQRRYSAQKRDLRRRRHLSDPDVTAAAAAVADPWPRPDQQAASHEAWLRWLESLPEHYRQAVIMLRDGFSYQETAAKLGCSERSLRRLMAKVRAMRPE